MYIPWLHRSYKIDLETQHALFTDEACAMFLQFPAKLRRLLHLLIDYNMPWRLTLSYKAQHENTFFVFLWDTMMIWSPTTVTEYSNFE